MRNLFLLILFFGLFFGIQIVYFENSLNKNIQIDFEDVSKSIVSIESVSNTPQKKFGSGVIISKDGYIVTAFHILSGTLSSIKIGILELYQRSTEYLLLGPATTIQFLIEY